ncbi:hypothetical protein GQ53DRAFT_835242 [Thozetella sp. PMI_491]|nr:hypothetical protein GQ53DRAFT_835242 [Thozetella sp. PMI_491]
MERNKQPRKACDICYNRKLKCDGQKPRCSNCVVYESECTFVASSRKARHKKEPAAKTEDELRTRVAQLEGRLEEALHRLDRLERPGNQDGNGSGPSLSSPLRSPLDCNNDTNRHGKSLSRLPVMDLPPSQEVIPIIETFLSTCNSVIPLFHGPTLLRTVLDWYSHPLQRSPAVWAAINVVLALTYHQSDDLPMFHGGINQYIQNAQSVLTELTTDNAELLNVQVFAGLVMFYQGTPNIAATTVLTATALRLAHRLGLNTHQGSEHLDAIESRQRNRVFWIIYILDRDTSFKARTPPLQSDAEIDLDMPPEEPEADGAGFVFTDDGQSKMNFFRAQVQLAHIQGKVYEAAYSVWAQNAEQEEQAQKANHTLDMLINWSSQLPPGFTASELLSSGSRALLRFFCILSAARISCFSVLLRTNHTDEKWIARLQGYGKNSTAGELLAPLDPILPHRWELLVAESKEFLWLFAGTTRKDLALIWMVACGYTCGVLCLVANKMCNGRHVLEFEKQLIEISLGYMEEMARMTGNDRIQKFRDICTEISRYETTVEA